MRYIPRYFAEKEVRLFFSHFSYLESFELFYFHFFISKSKYAFKPQDSLFLLFFLLRKKIFPVDCNLPRDLFFYILYLFQAALFEELQPFLSLNTIKRRSSCKKFNRLVRKMRMKVFAISLVMLACELWSCSADERNLVSMTLVRDATAQGAVCLDGSLPAYHLDKGFGSGSRNWLLQFEGGGWCNDVDSCFVRARSRRGSTRYMNKMEVFSGILSRNASLNPDFYNWNRVKLRYCDGASFAGDGMFYNQTTKLYFRGQRIWRAIILDLLPKGLNQTDMALLSGCSAGGLATFFHCDNLTSFLPKTATVKCLSDAGFFLDIRDVTLNHTARTFYESLITLQGIGSFLNKNCTSARYYPHECFFPQYALTYIKTPYFILNSAYDVYQFHHHLVPPSADLHGHWKGCKLNLASCTPTQLGILQGFRYQMLKALTFFYEFSRKGGLFINSCFSHCQSESQDTWFAADSPRVHDKTIAEAVGDWYFERAVSKEVDCPYPCDSTCHNLVP